MFTYAFSNYVIVVHVDKKSINPSRRNLIQCMNYWMLWGKKRQLQIKKVGQWSKPFNCCVAFTIPQYHREHASCQLKFEALMWSLSGSSGLISTIRQRLVVSAEIPRSMGLFSFFCSVKKRTRHFRPHFRLFSRH